MSFARTLSARALFLSALGVARLCRANEFHRVRALLVVVHRHDIDLEELRRAGKTEAKRDDQRDLRRQNDLDRRLIRRPIAWQVTGANYAFADSSAKFLGLAATLNPNKFYWGKRAYTAGGGQIYKPGTTVNVD